MKLNHFLTPYTEIDLMPNMNTNEAKKKRGKCLIFMSLVKVLSDIHYQKQLMKHGELIDSCPCWFWEGPLQRVSMLYPSVNKHVMNGNHAQALGPSTLTELADTCSV